MCKKYVQTPYEHILDLFKDAPRSGRPVKIDHRIEANITLIACSDPDAEKIRLVQDNLNTHTPGAFYEVFPPDEAEEPTPG